jgi:NAD(P)-dependent dehydrogenase (short-subunit alcohol dehydrogenase family)
MPDGLNQKVIAVAGGATGIGRATARQLATGGAAVVIGDINVAGAEETADQIRGTGGSAIAIRVDIAVEADVAALVGTAMDTYGGLDGYFNNAADLSTSNIGRDTDAVTVPIEVWQHTLDVNLTGFLFGVRHAVPLLLQRGGGAIVHTSSEDAFSGDPRRVAYAASKAAVLALSRHTASRWGRQGIRSNCVAPGLVLTDHGTGTLPRKVLDRALERARSTRHGYPDDIAAMVCYLMSDDAEWINGQVFRINGGLALT